MAEDYDLKYFSRLVWWLKTDPPSTIRFRTFFLLHDIYVETRRDLANYRDKASIRGCHARARYSWLDTLLVIHYTLSLQSRLRAHERESLFFLKLFALSQSERDCYRAALDRHVEASRRQRGEARSRVRPRGILDVGPNVKRRI